MAGTKIFTAFCGCGYTRRLPASERPSIPRCPGCGKLMTVDNAPPRPKTRVRKASASELRKPGASVPRGSEPPKFRGSEAPKHRPAPPPLKTILKPGAKFFDCACGERVLLLELTGSPIQCPGCERFHHVQMEAPPPPAPKPAAARPAPSGTRTSARPLGPGEFLCECGEVQPPRTSRTGRDFTCKTCGRKGYVEVDPGPRMRPVFTSGPAPSGRSESPVTPVARSGEPAWTCLCGQAIDAKSVLAKKEATCPRCGRRVQLEKHHPHASVTLIRPRFTDPAPPPPADLVADLERFEETAPCPCGARIPVSDALVGLAVQCGSCEAVMMVESNSGKLTLRSMTEL